MPALSADHETANEALLRETRASALKTIETVFACIVLLCVACALAMREFAEQSGIPASISQTVTIAFLTMAAVDLAALFGCKSWLSRS